MRQIDLLENNRVISISDKHPNEIYNVLSMSNINELEKVLDDYISGWRKGYIKGRKEAKKSFRITEFKIASRFLRISNFLYSLETQNLIFVPIVSDWQEEYFEALNVKEIWKARWINVRYTYAFLLAMWQKSPIGDLIEFIMKVAK